MPGSNETLLRSFRSDYQCDSNESEGLSMDLAFSGGLSARARPPIAKGSVHEAASIALRTSLKVNRVDGGRVRSLRRLWLLLALRPAFC